MVYWLRFWLGCTLAMCCACAAALTQDEAMRLDPAWAARPFAELERAVDDDAALMRRLEPLNVMQETEADTEGLKLAWRAGWDADKAANYFRKVQKASHDANFDRPGYLA